jgi:hypothetical protein
MKATLCDFMEPQKKEENQLPVGLGSKKPPGPTIIEIIK